MVIIPAIIKRLAVCFGLCSFALSAPAATYYIDFAGGSDSNSGTSQSSPWQRAPGMKGFGHAYNHAQGDRFIFKGGVTWPASCFTMTISQGGSSSSNMDYYGVDRSWSAGSSWTRPLIDFQNTVVGMGINLTAAFVNIDNLEFAHFTATGYWGGAQVAVNTKNVTGNGGVVISNCLFRDWRSPSTADVPGNTAIQGFESVCEASHCEFHQQGITQKSGVCTWNVGYINFCEFHHTPNAILGGGIIHDNHIHDITFPTDPLTHGNAIETFGNSTIYNNLIHDLAGSTAPMLLSRINWVYNNVLYNTGGQTPIGIDTVSDTSVRHEMHALNNTVVNNGLCIRGGGSSIFECINNHVISDVSGPIDVGTSAQQIVHHNIVQNTSQASSGNYSASNNFRPMTSGSATVNAGASLSYFNYDINKVARPQSGAWDVGAYEWGGSAPPPSTPTPTPATTPTPGSTATPTPTPTPFPSATPSPGPTVAGLSFNATDGIITPPFVATGNGISQGIQTVDPTLGGRAAYSFNITDAGDYGIVADVICPGDASNSFFINIDDDPTAPLMIWDVGVTSGVESRIVSWRGTGTDTSNQFSPKIFTLTQGTHQLILRGRESAAEIDHITLVKVPSPPANLSVRP